MEDKRLDDRERDYLRRRHRRRTQCSTMIGVVGLLLLLGTLLENNMARLLYLFGVVCLTLWVALLAMVDILSTRAHYNAEQGRQMTERAKLEAELQEARRRVAEEKNNL